MFSVLCQLQLQTSGSLTAVLGSNKYEITCTYNGLTTEQITGLSLKLQKGGVDLVVIHPLYLNKNTTIHSSVQNRVVVARFGASNPVTKVTFNSITCDEGGSYTWSANYYADTGETTVTATQQITVKGKVAAWKIIYIIIIIIVDLCINKCSCLYMYYNNMHVSLFVKKCLIYVHIFNFWYI